ncbi:unnamed protein product [Gordionus sp. m RMFG-2023]|uniref:uncharacterized protein LOC135926326 n=1 Tax=Gordionus sp. m RMFG-2023 TaxID=3053472 RepID=UPI0030E2F7DC
MPSGRKKDPIWRYYDEIKHIRDKTGTRAICKKCKHEMQGLVERLKNHKQKCTNPQEGIEMLYENLVSTSIESKNFASQATFPLGPSMPIIVLKKQKINKNDIKNGINDKNKKEEIDKQIAKAIYATNSSIKCVEHPEFIKTIHMLRPGYEPPSRKNIAEELLNKIYDEEKVSYFNNLTGKTGCLAINGWSTAHQEPIIYATITSDEGDVYLLKTIDTTDHPLTEEYLIEISQKLIDNCYNDYNLTVTSFVIDKADMIIMRDSFKTNDGNNIITYGCSVHLLHLLSQEMENVNSRVEMPEPISHIFKTLGKNMSNISDSVNNWKNLRNYFNKLYEDNKIDSKNISIFNKRYKQALTPAHFLAYILNPKYTLNLTNDEREMALEYAAETFSNSNILPIIIQFQAKSEPFKKIMFCRAILDDVTPLDWWISQENIFENKSIIKIVKQLFTASSSTPSAERVFSTFGLLDPKLNSLGTEAAWKLFFLFKKFNGQYYTDLNNNIL